MPFPLATSKRTDPRLGWRPDLPDLRDHYLAAVQPTEAPPLPTHTTNYAHNASWLKPYNQLDIGSCTANATERAHRIMIRRTPGGLHDFDGSRLAHYYWTRVIEGTQSWDSGATIRDAFKVLTKMGVAPERLWPYDVAKLADAPTADVVKAAAKRLRVEYLRVAQTPTAIKQVLAAKHPIVFGMSVFESTMKGMEDTGFVPVPTEGESMLGGHAICAEDYDDVTLDESMVIVANSWGDNVGIGAATKEAAALREKMKATHNVALLDGYFVMPMRMLCNTDIADDLWTIRRAA